MGFEHMRVAIPGGGGFLGTFLASQLRTSGADVIIPRQKDGWDFRRQDDCRRFFRDGNFDLVINCAAFQGGIGFHQGREATIFHDNLLMGTFLQQEACLAGVKKFVNIVAGCAYPGYLESEELREEDFWNGAVHDSIFSYGYSRKISVIQGKTLRKSYGFNSIHLVMANMYGPGEHFHPEQSKALAGLIKKVHDAAQAGSPQVEIWGTGRPIRDWLYVKDGAAGILRAAERYNDAEPLNIATGVGVSITELAETIKRVTGYSGTFVYDTSRPDGALKKIFSTRNMKKALDWMPTTSLEDGIRETAQWLAAHYAQAVAY